MLARILLAAVLVIVAPVPTVWLFYQYGEWLFYRFQDIGIEENGAGFLVFFCLVIAAMILIAGISVALLEKGEQLVKWFKTGQFHA